MFGRNDHKNERILHELTAIGRPALVINRPTSPTATDSNLPFSASNANWGAWTSLSTMPATSTSVAAYCWSTRPIWDRVIETQLNAVFLLSKLAASAMVTRRRGKIINVGSMYSFFGSGLIPSYSAAKGAVIQLTKSMAIELAPHNIQVNAIAPGWIETDMTAPVRTPPMIAMNDRFWRGRPLDGGANPTRSPAPLSTWPRTRPIS